MRPALAVIVLLLPTVIFAQTPSFTYQGRFTDGGTAANGVYDMQFKLFDSSSVGTGNQLGSTITNGAVAIVNGVFTVQLNFGGAAFSGPDRFLELGVRRAGSGDPYTIMSPRQPLTSSVYAIRALSAATADSATTATSATNATNATNAGNSDQLGGVAANQYVLTTDPRLTVSGNFIQNTTSQQTASNFNISGNGTAGGVLSASTVNSSTQYNIASNRVFTVNGGGPNANSNTVAGVGAGTSLAPSTSTLGNTNSFFGWIAGNGNITGNNNSYFGALAGRMVDGTNNTFVGADSGSQATSGGNNSFFGATTGRKTTGGGNTFVGTATGSDNTAGSQNTFIGSFIFGNINGNGNTLVGAGAALNSPDLLNATAIGFEAGVNQNNSLVLGNSSVSVGIGTNAPKAKLDVSDVDVVRVRVNSNPSASTPNAGLALALNDQPKWSIAATNNGNLQFFNDATGKNAIFIDTTSNNIGLSTTSVTDKLTVGGTLSVTDLGPAGSIQLCRNSAFQIATCSSSVRYKKDLQPFTHGLALLNQLHPITFKWKTDNSPDLGFSAEDVAQVEPLLVTHNGKGEIEGVKYDRLTAVLVNAVKEQQQQIAQQQQQIRKQQQVIEGLQRVVCKRNRHATVCR